MSPYYNQAGVSCSFKFWSHMYGITTGTLNAYYRIGVTESLLFSVKGNRGNQWNPEEIRLPKCLNQFQIVLEAIRGACLLLFNKIWLIFIIHIQYIKHFKLAS